MGTKSVKNRDYWSEILLPGCTMKCDKCKALWQSCGPDQNDCPKCGEKHDEHSIDYSDLK